MSIQVHPSELKVIAKLSGQVKDIASNTKQYSWSSLHRLIVSGGWLCFYTNDGQVFLEWLIPLESASDDNYEVVVPAIQFNDLASKALAGSSYQISYQDGLLELSQGHRKLKIRTESLRDYPDPASMKPNDPTWLITASLLNKNLSFVAPFIDESNAKTSSKVATWTLQGDLIGGTLQLIVRAQGLPVPLVPMNFTKRSAKALSAFLSVLQDDVQITVSDKHYCFECPLWHHRLIIAKETISFREPQAQKGAETEVIKVDGPKLRSSVKILEGLLPQGTDRLLFKICGTQEKAVVKISTGLEDSKSSQDELSIVRESVSVNGGNLLDTQFSVSSKFLGQSLREMDGVVLTLKYHSKDKILYIEDECCNDMDTYRVAMLTVYGVASLKERGLAGVKK